MGVGRWVSSHVGAAVAVSVLVAFACASSVARCCAIHPPEGDGDGQSPEALAEEDLPAAMRSLRSSYTDVTKEALGMLAANVWVDGQGTAAVRLTDRAIRVTTAGNDRWEAYAVAASARRSSEAGGTPATVTTLCIGTAEWCDIATLTVPQQGEAGSYATFQCPSVCGGAELALSPELKDVSLDGPPDALLEARGTTREAAEEALAAWCALWRPTATTATWAKVVEEDHEEGACKIYFELDDRRSSAVTLSVPMGGGALEVEEGGR